VSRALWQGAISFGLVHVPVALHSAAQRDSLNLDMLDKRDMQPVGYQRINKKTGKPVAWDQIVKGYPYEKGHYVVLTDADFRAANVEATQTIDILSFVNVSEIPVAYFDTPYYLVPTRGGSRGYALMLQTLERTKKAALAQVVIRTRQRLAAVMPEDQLLLLCTLRYAYEIRSPEELPETSGKKQKPVSKKEVEMAMQLVDEMSEPFAPSKYKDTYRDDILARVKKKVKEGRTEEVEQVAAAETAPRQTADVIDLTTLLKKSLGKAKNHPQREKAKRRA
jgi:DNA end-binding protein Ku